MARAAVNVLVALIVVLALIAALSRVLGSGASEPGIRHFTPASQDSGAFAPGIRYFTPASHLHCRPLPPLPCRDDVARAAETIKVTGVGAEIGVNVGWFAAKNFRVWSGRYILVDAWGHRSGDKGPPDLNSPDESSHRDRFKQAMAATDEWASRRDVRKGLSTEVAKSVSDNELDWVYIDALHTYEAALADIRAWYPKVRECGIVSGDDYGDQKDTPFLSAELQERGFGSIAREFGWGVISAVQNFTQELGIELHVTWHTGPTSCYPHPAWYFLKPPSVQSA